MPEEWQWTGRGRADGGEVVTGSVNSPPVLIPANSGKPLRLGTFLAVNCNKVVKQVVDGGTVNLLDLVSPLSPPDLHMKCGGTPRI